jgi:undecaprenyl pyrophosphate phosphatase UppP
MEPISYLQAIVLGLLQGIAEPFPISSLGHAVIAPQLSGWNIHQNDPFFLAFLIARRRSCSSFFLQGLDADLRRNRALPSRAPDPER